MQLTPKEMEKISAKITALKAEIAEGKAYEEALMPKLKNPADPDYATNHDLYDDSIQDTAYAEGKLDVLAALLKGNMEVVL